MTDFLHHVFICLVQSLYLIFPLAWIQLSLSHGKDDHARFGFHSRDYAINACFPNYSLKNAHNGQFFAQVFFGPKNLNAESFGEKYFDPFKKETGVIEVVLIKIYFLLRHTYLRESTRSRLERKKMSQDEGD